MYKETVIIVSESKHLLGTAMYSLNICVR